jgi:hypothetical protein
MGAYRNCTAPLERPEHERFAQGNSSSPWNSGRVAAGTAASGVRCPVQRTEEEKRGTERMEEEQATVDVRLQGRVINVLAAKRFGFIRPSTIATTWWRDDDHFFHFDAVEELIPIERGDVVSYRLMTDAVGRLKAVGVRKVRD